MAGLPCNFQGTWKYFHRDLAHICTEIGEDLTIDMDIQGLVALDVHRAELTHAHLFETTVRALHHFRQQAQHHQARDTANPGVIQDAIGVYRRWCNMKTAAFPVAIAQDQHHGLLIPALSIAAYMQERRIMIQHDRLKHSQEID